MLHSDFIVAFGVNENPQQIGRAADSLPPIHWGFFPLWVNFVKTTFTRILWNLSADFATNEPSETRPLHVAALCAPTIRSVELLRPDSPCISLILYRGMAGGTRRFPKLQAEGQLALQPADQPISERQPVHARDEKLAG